MNEWAAMFVWMRGGGFQYLVVFHVKKIRTQSLLCRLSTILAAIVDNGCEEGA